MANTLISYWPAWTAITLAGLVTLNQAITESEKFANMLGRVGRSIYERSKRRYQMDQIEFSRAVRTAVNEERQKWEDDETRALNVVSGQMEFVTGLASNQQKQLNEFSFQVRCLTSYVEYEADWHHKLRMMLLRANGEGLDFATLPDHLDFSEFERNCREKNNTAWRTWGIA